MPYWRELRTQALTETHNYWTPIRTTVTVAAPVIAGILWGVFKPWEGWWPVLQIGIVSILGFFALWGLVFFVSLLRAPKQLDDRKTKNLVAAEALLEEQVLARKAVEESISAPRISASEKKQRELAVQKLENWTEEEKRILQHLLQHEQQDRGDLVRFSGNLIPVDAAMNKGKVAGLVQMVTTHGQHIQYRITPSFVEALKVYFHGE